jgi:HD-GYP domain-containing protein (c-di-GMP phosphodiesterase class II)
MTDHTMTAGKSSLDRAPGIGRELDRWQASALGKLAEWFGIEFDLIDGETGEVIHCAFDLGARDWSVRGQVCRAVAARGTAELIEEDDPLAVLAIPVRAGGERTLVAVGTFVVSSSATPRQLARAAVTLGLEADEVCLWMGRQSCWTAEMLARTGQLAAGRLHAEMHAKSLEREVQDLSLHLSTSYEEISLLYRLTQNLKLSSKNEELGPLALEWLAGVVPAESLAIQFLPTVSAISTDDQAMPELISHGRQSVDAADLAAMIEHFGLTAGQRPLIVNRPATDAASWPWPGVHELIIVSLSEGTHGFGWLVAINHQGGGEFGTVEASLLSSVGAILGIHNSNADLYQQQRQFFAGVVRALTAAIDAKDPYTCGHSDRVARVAVRLAEGMDCSQKQLETIYLSGLLHDVGKIGIDDNVLRKPGKLTEAEYEHIKTHAEIGYKILSDLRQLDDVLPVVLHHHEQWDGNGYPQGLAGDDIPMLARIVAVADSFDAMGSDRPYRQGMDDAKLDSILRDGAGTQWDPAVVAVFFQARDEIREISQRKVKALKLDMPQWI